MLKPIDPEKLFKVIKRAKKLIEQDNFKLKINALSSQLASFSQNEEVINLHWKNASKDIFIKDIVYCKMLENQTYLHLKNGKNIKVQEDIGQIQLQLHSHGFFCIHEKCIINLCYFDHYSNKNTGNVFMTDRSVLPLDLKHKKDFENLLKML